ncbi:MAG TPA: CDP-alcohol phosphatidyltransferase family protein [Kofleriaceae bacterium]|nr:CDP-alcohol phosphatidyltransferase family protein [Kofleriaceae bacterium]
MWNEVVAIYRASKKRRDINWWTERVCRPPAAVVVYFLRNTPITPNQVTFLSLVVAAGSGLMFALLPGHAWLMLAALVFELSFVLDCADGQLARLRRQASPLGHLLDFLMDEIKAMFIFACVAYRLWHGGGDDLYLVAGLGGLFSLASGLTLTSFMRRPEYGAPPPTADGQPAVVARRRGPIGLAVSTLEHGARIVVHYPSYIWLCALVNRIDIYFWAYAAVNALYLARCLLSVYLRLGRTAPEPAPLASGEKAAR